MASEIDRIISKQKISRNKKSIMDRWAERESAEKTDRTEHPAIERRCQPKLIEAFEEIYNGNKTAEGLSPATVQSLLRKGLIELKGTVHVDGPNGNKITIMEFKVPKDIGNQFKRWQSEKGALIK